MTSILRYFDETRQWSVIPGVINARNAQTGPYTVASGDNGSTIALKGAAFYTLTFLAASTYPSNFIVTVINEDAVRAKTLSIPGAPTRLLQRGEFAIIFVQDNVWYINRSNHWQMPPGPLTINVDFALGADTNDGWDTGAGNAMKTIEAVVNRALDEFDPDGSANPTQLTALMAANSIDTQGVHQAFHAWGGANGGHAIIIDGNGTATVHTTAVSAIAIYFGTVVWIRNITLRSDSLNGLDVLWGAKCYLDNVTFGPCGFAEIAVLDGAGHCEIVSNITSSGDCAQAIVVSEGASIKADSGATWAVSQPMTVTEWVLAASCGTCELAEVTFNLNGHAVTGSKALASLNGVILQSEKTLVVTSTANNAGNARFLLASTSSLATGQRCIVAAGGIATNAAVTVVDALHIDIAVGFVNVSGGTLQIGLPGSTDATTSFGGQFF